MKKMIIKHHGYVIIIISIIIGNMSIQKYQLYIKDNDETYKLIVERKKDIEHISTQVNDIHQIMNDLSWLVDQQQQGIDDIESHVEKTHHNVSEAKEELKKAETIQKQTNSLKTKIGIGVVSVSIMAVASTLIGVKIFKH